MKTRLSNVLINCSATPAFPSTHWSNLSLALLTRP
nr:MAG TPA: hypothetical protein [Caudoviricetes sp.]